MNLFLRPGLPKSDPKIVDWRDGSFWGKKSHEVAGCGIEILRMRNLLPCLVRSCEKSIAWRGGVRSWPAAAVVTPKIESVGYRRKRLHRVRAHQNGMVKPDRTENYGRQRGEAAIRQWHIDQPCRETAGVSAMVTYYFGPAHHHRFDTHGDASKPHAMVMTRTN